MHNQTSKRKHFYACFSRDVASKGYTAGWNYVKSREKLDQLKKHKYCVDAEERIVHSLKKRVNGKMREEIIGVKETEKIDVPQYRPADRKAA